MCIPRVNSCCCVCSLRTGTMIIGIVEAITRIGIVVSLSVFASDINDKPVTNDDQNVLFGIYIAGAVISCIQLVITLMFLCGVCSEKAGLMKPWLFFATIDVLMTLITLIIVATQYSNSSNSGSITSTISTSTVAIILKFYYFIVVYSYYKKLTHEGAVANFARG